MEPNPVPKMEYPRQRIRLLPTRGQPRLQLVVLILFYERVEDEPTYSLRLCIRPLSKIQIVRTAFENHYDCRRIIDASRASTQIQAKKYHQSAANSMPQPERAFRPHTSGFGSEAFAMAHHARPLYRKIHP